MVADKALAAPRLVFRRKWCRKKRADLSAGAEILALLVKLSEPSFPHAYNVKPGETLTRLRIETLGVDGLWITMLESFRSLRKFW